MAILFRVDWQPTFDGTTRGRVTTDYVFKPDLEMKRPEVAQFFANNASKVVIEYAAPGTRFTGTETWTIVE